jgi:hypothetical protein
MKLIKLNRRFKQFIEHGHTVAFRFDEFSIDTIRIEQTLKEMTSEYGYNRCNEWYGYFGKRPKGKGYFNEPRPYFITMRDEATASMVLLKIESSMYVGAGDLV